MSGLRNAFLTVAIIAGATISWSQAKPIELNLSRLLEPNGRGLTPAKTALQATGKRVRLEGFMALMDEPPQGGFWLCPSQVFQDESGAGSGDLPPNAVFVVVRGAGKKPIAHLAGRLSVTGILAFGPKDPRITLTLDSDKDIAASSSKGRKNR